MLKKEDKTRALTSFLVVRKLLVKHVNASLVAHERKSLNVLQITDSFDAECAARVLLTVSMIFPMQTSRIID